MNIFRRSVFLFAALGAMLCSCGGRHVAEAARDAGEPAFLEIFERPEGGWTAVSVSPFDGSRDSLIIDRPLSRLIVMSTSHYGFLDALDATDRIVGISGPDYLYTALVGSRQALAVRTPRFARSLPSLGEVVKASLHLLSFDLGPSLLRDEGVHGPDLPDLPTASEKREAGGASLDGETHATLGTVRGGTGAERSEASGGAERSEAVEPSELAPTVAAADSEQSEESGLPEPAGGSQSPVEHPELAPTASYHEPAGRSRSAIADVGYDAAPDYEKIVALRPEVVLTYAVSGAKSPFETKLEQLGIKVFTVNEHLERHPLARAAYIRLFGALTGQMAAADTILTEVKENYNTIAKDIANRHVPPRKVLLNIPYNDQWFVPSTENYLSAMISDAGGIVLGSESGKSASSVMSVEKAYSLSKEADCWLNVGWCHTREDLLGVNPIFKDMLGNIERNAQELGYGSYPVVWNDNKRVNPKGGNDIWQSGVARPDLVLRDLATILHPDNQGEANKTIYYRQIN